MINFTCPYCNKSYCDKMCESEPIPSSLDINSVKRITEKNKGRDLELLISKTNEKILAAAELGQDFICVADLGSRLWDILANHYMCKGFTVKDGCTYHHCCLNILWK